MSQHIIEADVAPTDPPPRVGMHYIDKVAKLAYISVGTSVVGDWVLQTTGSADYKADGSVSMTGTHNANSNIVDNLVLKRYGETINSPIISAGAVTFNLADGNVINLDLTENVTDITVSSILSNSLNCSFALYAKQDPTGSRTISTAAWAGFNVDWGLQGEPTLSTGANKTDVFAFTTRDGTNWAGFHGGYGYTTL